MRLTGLKLYAKFLSRNRLYSSVCIAGFAISLMFVILLGVYLRQELSVDNFQTKGDRIYMAADEDAAHFGLATGPYLAERYPEIESYARIATGMANVAGPSLRELVSTNGIMADSSFFNIFSFPLIDGDPSRVLSGEYTVVLSRSFSRKIFGDQNPVGRELVMSEDGFTAQITGIMEDFPQNTIFPESDWVASIGCIAIQTSAYFDQYAWAASNFGCFFLEREGADLKSKEQAMTNDLTEVYASSYGDSYKRNIELIPLREAYYFSGTGGYFEMRSNNRFTIIVYTAIVILILVIAILNYVNMTVAQAGFRGREAAVKRLMGSSRGALVGQLLGESLMMTLFAFLVAVLLAFALEPFFSTMLERRLDLASQTDSRAIVTAVLLILVTAFLSGVLPAMVISGFQPIEVVKGTFSRKFKTEYARALATFQNVVAITLLICTAFIIMQFRYMINYDPGFERDNILIIDNVVWETERMPGMRSVLENVTGVKQVSFMNGTPVDGGNNNSFELEGERHSFQVFDVDSLFFEMFGIEKLESTGVSDPNARWFNRRGYEALALDSSTYEVPLLGWKVAGIISDFNVRSLHQAATPLNVRVRNSDFCPWSIAVKLESGQDQLEAVQRVRQSYLDFNGGIPFQSELVDQTILQYYRREQHASQILLSFTLLTIVIMIMGVLAMSLYTVRQKQKQIAIRKVNGSTVGEILLLLGRHSALSVLVAFVIAVPVSWYAVSRWLDNFAYRISLNPIVFVCAGLAVLLLTLLCVTWQSWRTARTNPVEMLKTE